MNSISVSSALKTSLQLQTTQFVFRIQKIASLENMEIHHLTNVSNVLALHQLPKPNALIPSIFVKMVPSIEAETASPLTTRYLSQSTIL